MDASQPDAALVRHRLERVLDAMFATADELGIPVRAPAVPGPQQALWVGDPGEDGFVAWRPRLKRGFHELDDIAALVGQALPGDVHGWFNSWWFLELEGQLGDRVVALLPVPPGAELEGFRQACRARLERRGDLAYLPLGWERHGEAQLVVHALEGSAWWEEGERRSWAASGLADLLDRLAPIVHASGASSGLAPPSALVVLIGAFRELPHGEPDGPSLKAAVRREPGPDESRLLTWLEQGEPCAVSPGVVHDVLDPERREVGTGSVLTDGTFAWFDDLAYYVRTHHVALPPAFVEHCRAHRWRFPDDVDVEGLELVPIAAE